MIDISDIVKSSYSLKLLYVEDNKLVRESTSLFLEDYFKDIVIAVDGNDGFDKFKECQTNNPIDIIITDINMPVLNGLEMAERIKKINEDIPILVISAHQESSLFAKGIEIGIEGYLFKPLVVDQFLLLIKKVIKNIHNKKEMIILKEKLEKRGSRRIEKIISHSDKQDQRLRKLNKELDEHKNHLEEKVEEEILKRKEKERILLHQSKLAAMGEMIDAVAHQWKQPINIINMQVDMMGYDFEDGLVNQQYVDEFQKKVAFHVKHMTSTLDEFRSFFRPNKELKEFNIKNMIDSVLLLVKDEFVKNKIEVIVDDTNNFTLNGIENEFKHLVLNIINNSKDAFNDNKTENRKIKINILNNTPNKIIEFIDNAGGIPENVIDDIFHANVTTKAEGKGTGIGLYMSSQIAQKHNGVLSVVNVENGAKFIFELV